MAERVITPATVPPTYADLRRSVEDALLHGQRRVEQAKLRTYWETGWLIKEHLLLNAARAEYGAQVIPRLARDLKVDERTLYECLKFTRLFPILGARPELTWAHYRRLIQIADPARRKALMTEAIKREWTSEELAERVVQENATEAAEILPAAAEPNRLAVPATLRLLTPKRGLPGVCRVADIGGALVVDLGFACYLDLNGEQTESFNAGDLVRVDGAGKITAAGDATKADLFHYRVEILKVVDGDTLWVKIYLRPRQWLKQKLRLRGLDCPEIDTPEGKASRRFVDGLVANAATITISTTKPDKYDRYLADVFVTGSSGAAPTEEDIFLNNALLENGHAVRKDAWEFGDWEPELVG